MKLISARFPMPSELKHAYSAEEAVSVVKQHLDAKYPIDGLDHLRSFLALNFDFEVLNQVSKGEWLLIKPEAYYFDYAPFREAFRHQRVMELMAHPLPHEKPDVQVFRVLDSLTGEWLVNRRYTAIIDGKRGQRRIDEQGITHLMKPAKGASITFQVKP